MKALSLWQPWATLLVIPDSRFRKEYETRSWPMPVTLKDQTVAIHAAQSWRPNQQALVTQQGPIREALLAAAAMGLWDFQIPPLGGIVGSVTFRECMKTDALFNRISMGERAMGDWTPGRWAWRTDWPSPLRRLLTWRGHQGVFEIPVNLKGYQR